MSDFGQQVIQAAANTVGNAVLGYLPGDGDGQGQQAPLGFPGLSRDHSTHGGSFYGQEWACSRSGRSSVSTHARRSVRLADLCQDASSSRKQFTAPQQPFQIDQQEAQKFIDAHYRPAYVARDKDGTSSGEQEISLFARNEAWQAAMGPGIGSFLRATLWATIVMLCFTLCAIPFWAMTASAGFEGFFGRYSTQLADVRESGESIPYMQPYSLQTGRISIFTVLPALSFAAILEDKDYRDLVSRMRYASTDMGRDWFLLVIALMDVAAVLVLLGWLATFYRCLRKTMHSALSGSTAMSSYAVLVMGLPEALDGSGAEEYLRSFFGEQYCMTQVQKRTDDMLCNGKVPESMCDTSTVISEIEPVVDMSAVLRLVRQTRKQELAAERAVAKEAAQPSCAATRRSQQAVAAYESKARDAQAAVRAAQSETAGVSSAFVIFQQTCFAADAVQRFSKGWSEHLPGKSKRKCTFAVHPALAPNDYIFDNLAFPESKRRLRKLVSGLVLAALLIAAFFAVCGMKAWLNKLEVRLHVDHQQLWTTAQSRAPDQFADVSSASDSAGWSTACNSIMSQCIGSPHLNPFQSCVDTTFKYGSYLIVQPNALQAFYSNAYLGKLVVAKERCEALLTTNQRAMYINLVLCLLIVLVNLVLGAVITQLVRFERHFSHSAQHSSQCVKMAVTSYLNTSITPLLASAQISWLSAAFGRRLFRDGFPDFTTAWYAVAGTEAVVLLVTSALLPRILNVVTGYAVPALRRLTTPVHTQEHHHALLLNGEFKLARAVAEVALLILHTLTFGAGVPLLYPLCALGLLIILLDNKIKLKYMWPIPPRFNTACSMLLLRIVHVGAFLHVAFAVWMISFFRTWGQIAGSDPIQPSTLSAAADSGTDPSAPAQDSSSGSAQPGTSSDSKAGTSSGSATGTSTSPTAGSDTAAGAGEGGNGSMPGGLRGPGSGQNAQLATIGQDIGSPDKRTWSAANSSAALPAPNIAVIAAHNANTGGSALDSNPVPPGPDTLPGANQAPAPLAAPDNNATAAVSLERLAQPTGWAHLILLGLMAVALMAPALCKCWQRCVQKRQSKIAEQTTLVQPAEGDVSFDDALALGAFKHGSSYSVFEVERELLFAEADLAAAKQRASHSHRGNAAAQQGLYDGAAVVTLPGSS